MATGQDIDDAPRSGHDLLERIRLERPHLPRRLRDIADAVIAAPREIATLRTGEIAGRFDVSASALVRFAQAIGFSGFAPMQKVLLDSIIEPAPRSYAERIDALTSEPDRALHDIDHIYEAFLSANSRALEAARESIDAATLSRVVDLLRGARLIGVAGERRAFPVATYLTYGLAQLDLPTVLLDGTGGMLGHQVRALGNGDLLFVISFFPNAPAAVETAFEARRRGARVVVLTDRTDNPVAEPADEAIIVREANLNDIRSIAVSSTLVQTLFVSLGLPEARRRRGIAVGEDGGKQT